MKGFQFMLIIAMMTALAACGGASTPDARTPAGRSSASTGGAGEIDGDPDAPPSVPCETSDDCAKSQICVDDECAIPVPAGFY